MFDFLAEQDASICGGSYLKRREFYITADKVTAETTRRFHLKANVDGGILSQPILLHVRRK